MRILVCALLLLGACGQNTQKAEAPEARAGSDRRAWADRGARRAGLAARYRPRTGIVAERRPRRTDLGGRVRAGAPHRARLSPCQRQPHRRADKRRLHRRRRDLSDAGAGAGARTGAALRLRHCSAGMRHLLALMPQIDACIAAAPEARRVTYAGDDGDGAYLVRLWSQNGGVDCSVCASGVAQIGPRDDDGAHRRRARGHLRARPGAQSGRQCFDAPRSAQRRRRTARLDGRPAGLLRQARTAGALAGTWFKRASSSARSDQMPARAPAVRASGTHRPRSTRARVRCRARASGPG